jgi:hypothetical protein
MRWAAYFGVATIGTIMCLGAPWFYLAPFWGAIMLLGAFDHYMTRRQEFKNSLKDAELKGAETLEGKIQ